MLDTTVTHSKLVKNVEGVLYVKPGDVLMALPQLNRPPLVKVWDCVWDFFLHYQQDDNEGKQKGNRHQPE